jgi:cell division protein FtsI (penicillin-binding protein 3)
MSVEISVETTQPTPPKYRLLGIVLFYVTLSMGILGRYVYISLLHTNIQERIEAKTNTQGEGNLQLLAWRKNIVDREHRLLAVTIPSPSIFILKKKLPTKATVLDKFKAQLHITPAMWQDIMQNKQSFVWLYRQMDINDFNKLGDLTPYRGFIGKVDEPKRYYPQQDIAAGLLGIVGKNNEGLEGLEKVYDGFLKQKNQSVNVLVDGHGNQIIDNLETLQNLQNKQKTQDDSSQDVLVLSIDSMIQQVAQRALSDACEKSGAVDGSAIVVDVDTGDVLAIASYPGFNANDYNNASPDARRMHPIVDGLELGSIVKPVLISRALDLGTIKPTTMIFGEHGLLELGYGQKIHDTHENMMMTIEQILQRSSNIGAYKVSKTMGKATVYQSLNLSGLARPAGTGFPGEFSKELRNYTKWQPIDFANIAFGQGFLMSPLQAIHGFTTVLNGGIDRGVSFIYRDKPVAYNPLQRYISPKTSKLMAQYLKSVVEEGGTAFKFVNVNGVQVAGKTGTAQKYDPKTRSYSGRTGSFIGVLPADNPKIAILVVVDDPTVRPAYGNVLAGPAFSQIANATLQYYYSKGVSLYVKSKKQDDSDTDSGAANN